MNADSFSLDDLLSEGRRGVELRAGLAQAVAVGATDSALCLQFAMLCKERGQFGMALWFLGTGLEKAPLGEEKWPNSVAESLMGAAGSQADVEKGLPALVGALDRLGADMYENCMDAIVAALAGHPEKARELAELLEKLEALRASETALCIKFAVRQFAGDLKAAGEIAQKIMNSPRRNRWTCRALAKWSALKGDYAKTEELCKRAIREHGPASRVMGELIAALYCQGKKKEAREFRDRLSRAANAEGHFKERAEEVSQWAEQLRQAMEEKREDGGALFNIGAAANYAEEKRAREYWRAHLEESVEENAYRNVNAYTNSVMFGRAEELLAEHPGIKKIINYGTLCGVRENALAARRPDCLFAGYDISKLATEMNRERFKQENLSFSSDLDGLLAEFEEKPGKTLLVHCRTADVMFPEALKRVYENCHAHGVEFILSAEYVGFRIAGFDYPDFGPPDCNTEPVDTLHWDGILMVHNYDKIFPETGYEASSSAFLPTPLLTQSHGKQETLLIRLVLARRKEK